MSGVTSKRSPRLESAGLTAAGKSHHRAQRKVVRNRSGEVHRFACGGVRDGKFPCVKELTGKICSAAVGAVARDGMAEMFEVDANLVGASCFWPTFQQRKWACARENFPKCLGGARAGSLADGHTLTVDGMPGNRAGYHTGRRAGFATHDGQISFLRRACGELSGEFGVGGVGFGDEDATARIFVETMNDTRAQRMFA